MIRVLSSLALVSVVFAAVPLDKVFYVVQNFPTTEFCSRICTSYYEMLPENVRFVTFTGALNEDETADELCDCIYNYMDQKNWLDGASYECITNVEGYGTLALTGQPDPDYDPNASLDSTFDQPLEQLEFIFDQFPEAELGGLNCVTSSFRDTCTCVHCLLECDKNVSDTRTKESICGTIGTYLDQNGWLGQSTTNCHETDDQILMEFIGNSQPGDSCVAPTYF